MGAKSGLVHAEEHYCPGTPTRLSGHPVLTLGTVPLIFSNAAVFNTAIFNTTVFNTAVFNTTVFNTTVFNTTVFNTTVFNTTVFNAIVTVFNQVL